ncbi:MAG: glycosyltransferase [Phycisphaerales bacterium]|nr:glycosyltransferase [Phycisphaerales bacterium]
MTLPVPKFSTIIASHGRASLLAKLLESLNQAQSSTAANVEILVVDSTPAAEDSTIQEACVRFGATLIKGPLSVRSKRNMGARSATGDWLFFVDSDCEVSPEIFNNYRKAFDTDSEFKAGAGPTVFRNDETPFTRLIQHSSLLSPFRQPAGTGCLLWATTSNLVVRKDVFDAVGGFREDFPFRLGGDDTDFCLRLHSENHQIRAVPEAICFHSWLTWSRPSLLIRRSFRWGWMHAILLREHPRYRRIDAPGLPVHALACAILACAGAFAGFLWFLLAPVLFIILSIIFHAVFVSVKAASPRRAFIEDLALALVELPFGFGRVVGSLTKFSLLGLFFRLDADNVAAYQMFPETARGLWCDHLAFLCIAICIGVAA